MASSASRTSAQTATGCSSMRRDVIDDAIADEGGMATIDLAHEPPFEIGALTVRPATRTVARNGIETVVEPRVMQVLVALAQARGAVLSRDDLVERCWNGRIVGDDAINRVLSRLRRLSDETEHAFAIETITRVGYRLVQPVPDAPHADPPAPSDVSPTPAPTIGRRGVLALGGGAAAALLAGGGIWIASRNPSLPPAAVAAMARGEIATSQTVPEQNAVAVAAFRSATELAPNAAEPWGRLALAYRQLLAINGARDPVEASLIERRGQAAIARALALDPANADALVARATLMPVYRHWGAIERNCRPLLARFPDHGQLNLVYGIALTNAGRYRDGLARFRKAIVALPEWPQVHMRLVNALWTVGLLDEADAVLERAFATWPRHYSVWFSRERIFTYSGRGAAALAMFADRDSRPIGIPDWNFAMSEAETRAITTRASADIARAATLLLDGAHRAVAFAASAAIFNTAIGQIDTAFALLNAFFFNRGFTTGPERYSKEQGMYDSRRERDTTVLFQRDAAPLRADARFAALTREIGLEAYWRESGSRPDYR